MEQVLIAGGTGFIGNYLKEYLSAYGWKVAILTRSRSKALSEGFYFWNPTKREIDQRVIQKTSVLINLSGSGIAEKRWNKKRIGELYDSRLVPTQFLIETFKESKSLKAVIQASGGTCYGYSKKECYVESDPYGKDVIGELTKAWEKSAQEFATFSNLTLMRLGIVLGKDGGALPKLAATIKLGVGSALGSGKQLMPWIHIEDVARFCIWTIESNRSGTFNLAAGNCSNSEITQAIAKSLNKPIFMPNVPAFVLKIVLGKRSELLLESVCLSNGKLKENGFNFYYSDLQNTINATFV